MRGLYIKTYGCQMNVYDSLMMNNMLKPLGFVTVDTVEKADLVILNTCHIREKAAEKLYSELGCVHKIREKKKKNIIVVVAGCVAQAEGKEVFKRAPFVDIIVGPQSIHTLPELIAKVEKEKGRVINIDFPEVSKFDVLGNPYEEESSVSAFLSIQEGCDKFCTFCVVPYTRGAEYSRPVNEVFREALSMVRNGAKEITLLGQNVNAYHGECEGKSWDLGLLIRHLAKIDGLKRIRYTTSHPRDMHQSLYDAHLSEPKLMPFVHLPVQSGSNRILVSMNRKHTVEQYLEIIVALRAIRSDIEFSSDFIVGFPGETEIDFEDTMKLVDKVGFVQAYSFKYSPRPGTPGSEYLNQVPEEVKSERLSRLQQLISLKQMDYNKSMIGKTLPVLLDKKHGKFDNQIIGKTPYMQSVHISTENKENHYGKIMQVKILEGYQNSLQGKLLEELQTI